MKHQTERAAPVGQSSLSAGLEDITALTTRIDAGAAVGRKNLTDLLRLQRLREMANSLRRNVSSAFGGTAAISQQEGAAAMPSLAAQAKPKPRNTPFDFAEVRAGAIRAERARLSAILSHPEARGREVLALAIALESDLTAEQAWRILSSPAAGPRRA